MNHPTRLISLLFFFAVCSGLVFGQAPPADKKAQEILNGVSSRYKTYKSVKANFTITVSNPKDKSKTVEKGTLYLKGSKYKLDVAGQEVISDGKTRWTYVKDANEVQIDVQRTDENGITPTNIFTMYEKGWNSRFMGETKEGIRTLLQIELVPVDPKKKNIFKVKLSINKADKSIISAVMYDKNGSTQSITVDKFLPDGASEESIYVFSAGKYPGAEVIDLR
jgi:outer membrane lipoprotein-sorting protein